KYYGYTPSRCKPDGNLFYSFIAK
ncbi:AraC family transcriptional regulator, partial [Salmonella enterica]|nr:AraC family transcriptional regulator [Salmonella enterica]